MPRGMGHIMRFRGRAFWRLYKTYYRIFSEGSNSGERFNIGNLGRNIRGEISFLKHMHMHPTNEYHPAQLERE